MALLLYLSGGLQSAAFAQPALDTPVVDLAVWQYRQALTPSAISPTEVLDSSANEDSSSGNFNELERGSVVLVRPVPFVESDLPLDGGRDSALQEGVAWGPGRTVPAVGSLQGLSEQQTLAKRSLAPVGEVASLESETIVADVPEAVLRASRDRFRDLVLDDPEFSLERVDDAFIGTLREPTESRLARVEMDGPHGGMPVATSGSLSVEKTYTVVGGQIVEVAPDQYQWSGVRSLSGDFVSSTRVGDRANGSGLEVIGPDQGAEGAFVHPEGTSFVAGDSVNTARVQVRTCAQPAVTFEPLSFDDFLAGGSSASGCAVVPQVASTLLATVSASPLASDALRSFAFQEESGNGRVSDLLQPHPGHADFWGSEDVSARSGAYVRGRIAVPIGFDPRKVFVRLAGSSIQVNPDAAGFFELGPFALGASFELLIFDDEARLNRRIVPVFVSAHMREPQIEMFRSQDIVDLIRSFRVAHKATDAGFCGEIRSRDRASISVSLVDIQGRTHALSYFSDRGFPEPDRSELSSSRRVCAFGLAAGLYRLRVAGAQNRADFELHLKASTFENGVLFDATAHVYASTATLGLVDSSVASSPVDDSSGRFVSLSRGLQNLWLSGQDVPVWAPVLDHLFQSTSAYAPVQAEHLGVRRFIPVGQELIKLGDASSRSFELVGRDAVQAAHASGKEVAHHILPEDAVSDLRLLLPGQVDAGEFVLFADLDTALLPASMRTPAQRRSPGDGAATDSAGSAFDGQALGDSSDQSQMFDVTVRDIWTGERVSQVVYLSNQSDRILRFAAAGLPAGGYLLSVRTSQGQLAWSSVIRSVPGETQVVSNR